MAARITPQTKLPDVSAKQRLLIALLEEGQSSLDALSKQLRLERRSLSSRIGELMREELATRSGTASSGYLYALTISGKDHALGTELILKSKGLV
jgi:predicted transcriptional regulator